MGIMEELREKRGTILGAMYICATGNEENEKDISTQLNALHDFAQKNNVVIIEQYIDTDCSVPENERTAFNKMMEDAQNKTFDVILVQAQAKISENIANYNDINFAFWRNGIWLVNLDGLGDIN